LFKKYAYIIAICLALFSFLIRWHKVFPTCFHKDFLVYFLTAKNIQAGVNIYDNKPPFKYQLSPKLEYLRSKFYPTTPFSYPPLAAYLFYPLIYLPYEIAKIVFLVVNILCLILATYIWTFYILKEKSNKYFIFCLVLNLCFAPVFEDLCMGQLNEMVFLFLSLFFLNFIRKRYLLASLFLNICIIIKPFFMFMVFIFFSIRKFKAIFIMGGVFLAFILLSLLSFGINTHKIYIFKILPQYAQISELWNYSLHGFCLNSLGKIVDQNSIVFRGIYYGIIIFILFIYIKKLFNSKNILYRIVLTLITLLLLLPVVPYHYFLWLLGVYYFMFYQINVFKNDRFSIFIILISFIIIGTKINFLFVHYLRYYFPKIINILVWYINIIALFILWVLVITNKSLENNYNNMH